MNKDDTDGPLCSIGPIKLSKREVICMIIGGVIISVAVIVFIILAVVLSSSSSSPNGGSSEPNEGVWSNIRLPSSLSPVLYRVSLDTDLNMFRVDGVVSVDISAIQSTDLVIFHTKDMTLNSVSLTSEGRQLDIKRQFFYTDNDFYVIQLSNKLSAGNSLQLNVSFNYTLREDLVGYYKSSYSLGNNEIHYLATTQFEPTDARRAFPCFDEPAMKANFSIELTHSNDYHAVSNMPIRQVTVKDNNKLTTSFNTSYKMSTYLVAFVVSDFNCTEPQIVNNHIKVSIIIQSLVSIGML